MRDGDNYLVFVPSESNADFGRLCVRHTVIYSDKPEGHHLYWPVHEENVSIRDAETTFPELENRPDGVSLYDSSNGCYDLYRGNGQHCPIRLINAGKTQAIRSIKFTVDCPKVRKGVDTRYRAGKWEKYLKSQGWTSVDAQAVR